MINNNNTRNQYDIYHIQNVGPKFINYFNFVGGTSSKNQNMYPTYYLIGLIPVRLSNFPLIGINNFKT